MNHANAQTTICCFSVIRVAFLLTILDQDITIEFQTQISKKNLEMGKRNASLVSYHSVKSFLIFKNTAYRQLKFTENYNRNTKL